MLAAAAASSGIRAEPPELPLQPAAATPTPAEAGALVATPPPPGLEASPEELGPPLREAFAHTTGVFAVRFDELADDERPAALLARLRPGSPPTGDAPLDLARELFFVRVPERYRREQPMGLLVWISPTEFGGVRRPDLHALLDERGLIWIGAHRAGNERALLDRHALALVAARAAQRHWSIDPDRIHVGGYSGGGRTASQLALLWPERFNGALMLMGCNWYQPLDVPGERGRVWTPSFPRPPRESLARARRQPLVFVTAERDFNRVQTHATARAAQAERFAHVTAIEIPGLDHYGRPPIESWRQALDALDALEAPAGRAARAGNGIERRRAAIPTDADAAQGDR